jgi:hypothetical protein
VKIFYFCMSRKVHTFWQLYGAPTLGFPADRARHEAFLHPCSSTAARTEAHLWPPLLDVCLCRWLRWKGQPGLDLLCPLFRLFISSGCKGTVVFGRRRNLAKTPNPPRGGLSRATAKKLCSVCLRGPPPSLTCC